MQSSARLHKFDLKNQVVLRTVLVATCVEGVSRCNRSYVFIGELYVHDRVHGEEISSHIAQSSSITFHLDVCHGVS
jgi:hypothetical protein